MTDGALDVAGLYETALVWDEHGGFAMFAGKPIGPMLDPWHRAGVTCMSISAGFDPFPPDTAMQAIAWVRRRLEDEAPYARLVGTVAELDRAIAEGKMGVFFDLEGMNALCGRVEMVSLYYDLGVRHMNFAYNLNNLAGSGCHDEDTGLTDFGRSVIDEMNRVGMVVDCTHTGYRTTMEAMERSSAPCIFSHSNPKALHAHGRNITDDQIRACAATGGVIGINGINLFHGTATTRPEDVARHAAYVAELTSVDHVALSLDYAPEMDAASGVRDIFSDVPRADAYWPAKEGYGAGIGCLAIDRLPDVAAELSRIGFDAQDLRKILGLNCRRVAEQVWK